MYYELTDSFIVRADLSQAWKFFGTASNLPLITPKWLGFTVVTPHMRPIENGTKLDYTIRWMGLKLKWRTLIIDWDAPRQFIDLQTKGPYTLWHHQHTFEAHAEGTLCRDRVIYKLPVAFLGRLVQRLVVRRQLLAIFRYRREIIGKHLGWVRPLQPDVVIRPL
jgi:ligand-binding SRPBCC domain-containing protein